MLNRGVIGEVVKKLLEDGKKSEQPKKKEDKKPKKKKSKDQRLKGYPINDNIFRGF